MKELLCPFWTGADVAMLCTFDASAVCYRLLVSQQ